MEACSLQNRDRKFWFTSLIGGAIMVLSILLFEEEFIHIVAISFTALIFNELLMVALEINTWYARYFWISYGSSLQFILGTVSWLSLRLLQCLFILEACGSYLHTLVGTASWYLQKSSLNTIYIRHVFYLDNAFCLESCRYHRSQQFSAVHCKNHQAPLCTTELHEAHLECRDLVILKQYICN